MVSRRQCLLRYVQMHNTTNSLILEICWSILTAHETAKEELLNLVALTILLNQVMLERVDCSSARTSSNHQTPQAIQECTNVDLDIFIWSTIGYPCPPCPPPPSEPSAMRLKQITQNAKRSLKKNKSPTAERNFRNHLKVLIVIEYSDGIKGSVSWFLRLLASITRWIRDGDNNKDPPHLAALAVSATIKRHCMLKRSLMYYENVQKMNARNQQFFMREIMSLVQNADNLKNWIEFIWMDMTGDGHEIIVPTPIHFIILSIALSKVCQP